MADAVEVMGGPPAVDQTGNLTVWVADAIANPDAAKVAELGATGAHRITYSFLPGGYNPSIPQEKLDDDRLTSPQTKQSFGKTTPTIPDLRYVDSTDPNSAAVLLKDGGSKFFIERRNTPQTQLAAAADKVRVWKVTLGKQAPGELNGEGKFTIVQPVVVEYVSDVHALTTGT